MTLPMVSVIIPTRNRLGFLKEAVASVSAQDYAKRETIVVDDASEDGTWEWLSSLQDPQVRILRPPHHVERSAARNLGLSHAQGEYVMFLDDDDLLVAGALSYLCEAVRRHPKALAVVGARIAFDGTGRWFTLPHPKRTIRRQVWADILFGWAPQVSQCVIRKSAVAEAGGWDSTLTIAEDHELWLRLVSPESVLVVLPRIVARYRVHPGQTRLVGFRRRELQDRRAFARRLRPGLQKLALGIIQSDRRAFAAGLAFSQCRYRKAARLYFAAISKAPKLLGSPLVRGVLLGGLARSVFGWTLGFDSILKVRRSKAWFRHLLHGRARPGDIA